MSLGHAAYSAGRWTSASTIFRAGVQLAQVALLARLLLPADFGLMAMAMVAVAITSLFTDFGLSSALIHFPLPSRRVLSVLFRLNILLGIALAGLLVTLAPPLASLYGQPDLAPVLMSLSLVFPINATSQQLRALAEKELRFQRLAWIESSSALGGFVAAVLAAYFDAGVYALVAATLTAATLGSLLAWSFLRVDSSTDVRVAPDSIRSYLQFGGHRVGEQIWNTIRQQTDVFFASLIAGASAVAMYSVPREQSLRIANSVVNPVVTRVGLPVMARLQNDASALRAVYLQTMRLTASLNFPAYALLACFSDEVVALLLGSQWGAAGTYMRIFALWGLIRSTGNPSGSLLYAVGLVRRAHSWNFALLLGTAPLLWLGAQQWDLVGLAGTMLVLQVLIFVLAWRFLIHPACGVSFREYLSEFLPPAAATSVAAGAAWLLTLPLAGPTRLMVGAAILASSYWLCSLMINRPWILTMYRLLEPILKTPLLHKK